MWIEVVCSRMGGVLSWHGHFVVVIVEVWKSEVLLYVLALQLITLYCV